MYFISLAIQKNLEILDNPTQQCLTLTPSLWTQYMSQISKNSVLGGEGKQAYLTLRTGTFQDNPETAYT